MLRATAERNHVPVGVLDVKILGSPLGRRQRSDDPCTVRGAPRVKRFDAIDAAGGVEMLGAVFGCFLQMELQSVELPDRVEPVPRLAEGEAELLVVRDRAREIVHQELGRKGGEPHRRPLGQVQLTTSILARASMISNALDGLTGTNLSNTTPGTWTPTPTE